jgi:hypothetical protein
MTVPPDLHAVPPRRADFARPLTCILGLPFDTVDIAQAVQRIRDAAFSGQRCFVSTPIASSRRRRWPISPNDVSPPSGRYRRCT